MITKACLGFKKYLDIPNLKLNWLNSMTVEDQKRKKSLQ